MGKVRITPPLLTETCQNRPVEPKPQRSQYRGLPDQTSSWYRRSLRTGQYDSLCQICHRGAHFLATAEVHVAILQPQKRCFRGSNSALNLHKSLEVGRPMTRIVREIRQHHLERTIPFHCWRRESPGISPPSWANYQ